MNKNILERLFAPLGAAWDAATRQGNDSNCAVAAEVWGSCSQRCGGFVFAGQFGVSQIMAFAGHSWHETSRNRLE
ncbi:MAG: hypothetical protein E6Q73_08570 [Pseudorhodobacter sp.]|nr:MAG: hypothetical protein E6Q73_08570 [Pseudorhodobacter sp.]